jgi:molecular chaperone GrpE (heat shock protein)
VRERIEQQKEKNKNLQADIARWKQEKVAHTKEAIGSWRQRREIDKLESRAERAEDHAADMVSVAVDDFDEAQQALLDALAARYEADSAASGAV